MLSLFFATQNASKIKEVAPLLDDIIRLRSIKELGCTESLPEPEDNLKGNSFRKAEYIHKHYGVDCLAEDTGLFIKSLNGNPGVYSARYAGLPPDQKKNLSLVLKNMKGKKEREAVFKTVLTLVLNGNYHSFEGEIQGSILPEPRGHQGFGYDAIFVPATKNQSFAEMNSSEKEALSHRSRAVWAMRSFLEREIL
ncbi:MAG: RdgB/HAM1 family non-canonical purine NTP pyrophosphatase [Cytophagales bacterium]|nr:RdgB/HAM1 family non-canonical purine NTP pyrophosphatase [Cytophagales bacterium]